ncbi:MAG: hypothetical protein KF761_05330 [Salinibacterium sp.]|nr:hypothetical protein [Salinibacterium sp.]
MVGRFDAVFPERELIELPDPFPVVLPQSVKELVLLVDRNYPAHSAGVPVVQLGEVSTTRALRAILSVLPLDTMAIPFERMEVNDQPELMTASQQEVLDTARELTRPSLEVGVIPRLEFYARARQASVIVHTLDARPWSCFVLRKGVVFDEM